MEVYNVKTAGILPLGKQGENLARQIRFDISGWISRFGPGTVQLLHQRKGDETPYPVAVEQEENLAVWTVTNADTALPGTGRAELQYYVGDTLAKSETWMTKVLAALGPASETPPEAQQSWVDQVLQAGAAAAEAAKKAENAAVRQPIVGSNGCWWIWDLDAGAYADTGIYSGGDAPYIGENGNWYVGQTDTGVPATGPQGSQGNSFDPRELFFKEFLKDPGNRNSFVTIDGVPYYRYHASESSFYYDIPNPRAGAVTITMRVADQYSTGVDSRICAVFKDGTEETIGWVDGNPFTYTTDAAKTLVRIRGNYDAENWMLVDLSVMRIQASWLAWEIPAAAETAMGGVYADQAKASDTQPVRIGTDGKLYTAPGGSVSDEAISQAVETYLTENPPEAGGSGVYVGSGDMPEGYNLQIDPEGTPDLAAETWTFTLEDGTTVSKVVVLQ